MSEQFEMFTPEVPEKKTSGNAKYPVLKIISLVFGILAGAAIIYYAVRYTSQYFEQINQYKQMGMDIPKSTLSVIYLQLALTFLVGILPIIGAIFPNKFAKLSLLFTAAPICWGLTNAIPTTIISIIQKAPLNEMTDVLLMLAGGVLSLVSAILIVATPSYCELSEDSFDEAIEEFSIEGTDAVEEIEEAAEEAEEAAEEIKETVEETVEAAEETINEVAEEADNKEE